MPMSPDEYAKAEGDSKYMWDEGESKAAPGTIIGNVSHRKEMFPLDDRKECEECEGSGEARRPNRCEDCHGSGEQESWDDDEPAECETCGGDGENWQCGECDGEGSVPHTDTHSRLYVWPKGEKLTENLMNRRQRPVEHYQKLLPEITEKAGLPADTKWKWDEHCGCLGCPCSPGFVAENHEGSTIHADVRHKDDPESVKRTSSQQCTAKRKKADYSEDHPDYQWVQPAKQAETRDDRYHEWMFKDQHEDLFQEGYKRSIGGAEIYYDHDKAWQSGDHLAHSRDYKGQELRPGDKVSLKTEWGAGPGGRGFDELQSTTQGTVEKIHPQGDSKWVQGGQHITVKWDRPHELAKEMLNHTFKDHWSGSDDYHDEEGWQNIAHHVQELADNEGRSRWDGADLRREEKFEDLDPSYKEPPKTDASGMPNFIPDSWTKEAAIPADVYKNLRVLAYLEAAYKPEYFKAEGDPSGEHIWPDERDDIEETLEGAPADLSREDILADPCQECGSYDIAYDHGTLKCGKCRGVLASKGEPDWRLDVQCPNCRSDNWLESDADPSKANCRECGRRDFDIPRDPIEKVVMRGQVGQDHPDQGWGQLKDGVNTFAPSLPKELQERLEKTPPSLKQQGMTKRKVEDFKVGEHVIATGQPEKGVGFVIAKGPKHIEVEWADGTKERHQPMWLDGTEKGLLEKLDAEASVTVDDSNREYWREQQKEEPKWTGLRMQYRGEPVTVSSEPEEDDHVWATRMTDGSPVRAHVEELDADWMSMRQQLAGE